FDLNVPVVDTARAQVELLNQKHAVVGNYGSKVMVMSWERWGPNPSIMVPVFQTREDFQARYGHRYAEIEFDGTVKREPLGKYWLRCPARKNYDGIEFEPECNDEVLVGNRLNLWRGFAMEPRPGHWPLMREHIYEVLGNGDEGAGRYIEWWLAWMYQHLGEPPETA